MRIDEVMIRKGEVFHETEHETLFHICDSHGFSYAVQENALRSLRHSYISTTYDPNNNSIVGISHAAFKLILDGKSLVSKYGGQDVDFFTIEKGMSRSRSISLKEREIGIMTSEIEPLDQYIRGVIFLFDPFTQKAMQDLLYDHPAHQSFMDVPKDQAIRGIDAIFRLKKAGVEFRNRDGSAVSSKEWTFLKAVLAVHNRGGDFRAGMRSISSKFPLKDHWGVDLDRTMVERTQKSHRLVKLLNSYYVDRPMKKIKPEAVKGLLIKAMSVLKLNPNIQTTIVHAAEEANLFHPVMAPVNWTSVFRDLIYGDVDEAVKTINWFGEELEHHRKWYEDSDWKKYGAHYGTDMA